MYERILAEASRAVWLMERQKLIDTFAFLRMKAAGGQVSGETVELMAEDNRKRSGTRISGSVAVMPMIGSIVQRGNIFTEASGTMSTEVFGREFAALVADDSVGSIVFDCDSPGGTSSGVPELGQQIFDSRGTKPIVSCVNSWCASASYWLASQADEVVVTPSGDLGSIGCYCAHVDESGLLEKLGVDVTLISYGQYKTDGNPYEPLGDDAKAEYQSAVDRIGHQFEKAVAKGRGVSVAKVKADFGQGRMVDAERAVKLGMADRVATLQQTVQRLSGAKKARSGRNRVASVKRFLET